SGGYVSLEVANQASRGANQQQHNRFEIQKATARHSVVKRTPFFRKLFSRAANAAKSTRALAPEGKLKVGQHSL
ncbi:MAG TPA: hypothetical protein VKF63_07230, partial [Terracidiphilus sp.]|nr:hypothetical protein [Terracidiphilus sp.]